MTMKQPDISSLAPEGIAQLHKAQKRRFTLALVLGAVMVILDYFTGQKLVGDDTNGADAVYTDIAVTVVMSERTPTAADFERTG